MNSISNEFVEYSFDQESGRLVSVRNLVTGNEYLNDDKETGNLFAVYYDFIRDFEISVETNRAQDTPSDPASITRRLLGPSRDARVEFGRTKRGRTESLTITYTSRDGQWRAQLVVSMESGQVSSRWKLKVTNTGHDAEPLMVVFPFISGLKLGDGTNTNNLMVVNRQSGYVRPLWSHEGGIYGNGAKMSMQWGCVFDECSKDAFGFVIRDDELRPKEIRYAEPSISVRYFPPQTLVPGGTVEFPEADLMVYSGDWKRTAQAYHDWFVGAIKPVGHADWVRNLDSLLGQWFEKRGQETSDNHRSIRGLSNPMYSFSELSAVYRRLPIDTIEFAFFCRGSMGEKLSGKVFTHTDGDNIVREDLGGAEALKEAVEDVHKLGFHFTLYIDGHICPADSDFVLHGDGADNAIMNKDGSNKGNFSGTTNWLHMCPGAEGWQDHLAGTAARLVEETGADGIRLDSLGAYFVPCYNPLHNHKSPYDYNLWMCELLRKVASAVKRANPQCFLSTEAPVDFYCRYFDGSLTQHWNWRPVQHWTTNQIAIDRDVAPMRVALPEYYLVAYNATGPVAASLMGYPGGSGGFMLGERMLELDLKWRSVRFAVADVIRWGDVMDNPTASRDDVVCRRFSKDGVDVFLGARPRYLTDFSSYANSGMGDFQDGNVPADISNADIDVKDDRVDFQVFIDVLDAEPAKVYLYDVETMSAREVNFGTNGKQITVGIDSNWFLLILVYGEIKPLAVFDVPKPMSPGKTYDLQLSLLGAEAGESTIGRFFAPGLGLSGEDGGGARVRVPGTAKLNVPDNTPVGKYPVTLSSDSFLGCKRFVEVG